jgi:hypothetical protein
MSLRYRPREQRQKEERRPWRAVVQYYQEEGPARAWTEEERKKWDQILPELQNLVRTFPHTEQGVILARNRGERVLADMMRNLLLSITEPVKRGNPDGLLEWLVTALRRIQVRENRKEWHDFQEKMMEWRSR